VAFPARRHILAAVPLAVFLFAALPLRAQDQTPPAQSPPAQSPPASNAPPVINTDRPAITDASTVVPSGSLLFENGFTETAGDSQRSFDFPETLVRFGLTSSTELRFTAPDYYQNFNTGAGFATGWGDLQLGVKQQLYASSDGFNVALIGELGFPTGAHLISSHGYDPSLLVPWSHPVSKNWTASGMFAVFWPTEGSRRNVTGQPSFELDRQLTSRWDAFVEYAGDFYQRGTPVHIFHVGSSFKLTNNQQLDFHVGFGLSAAAPDHFLGVGYSFQFQPLHR
jgi:hypothetical protein